MFTKQIQAIGNFFFKSWTEKVKNDNNREIPQKLYHDCPPFPGSIDPLIQQASAPSKWNFE